ncbi:MAG: hypothetical protein ABEJ27_00120 [Halodesulfurarchaeum sp.]
MPEEDRHIDLEDLAHVSLDEALSLIGDRTRAAIIVELGRARTVLPDDSSALGFSELMTRVGAEDSGGFNYHLQRLVGPFIKHEAAGYALRVPGQLLFQAIVGGTLTQREPVDPFPVGDCPRCGDLLSAAVHPDHLLTVECTGCATLFDAIAFPARGLADREDEELLAAAYQRRHHQVATMRRGVCPHCAGRVDRDLVADASITYGAASVAEMAGLETYATLACRDCTATLVGHPANVAVTTPPVVGFFADHDRDVAVTNWWATPIATARAETRTGGTEPRRVAIPFELDGECLTVTLDADLEVAGLDREAATG